MFAPASRFEVASLGVGYRGAHSLEAYSSGREARRRVRGRCRGGFRLRPESRGRWWSVVPERRFARERWAFRVALGAVLGSGLALPGRCEFVVKWMEWNRRHANANSEAWFLRRLCAACSMGRQPYYVSRSSDWVAPRETPHLADRP